MPKFPFTSHAVGHIAGNVYSALAHKLAGFSGEVYPLHVGDTWLEPAIGCRMEDLTVDRYPGMHRYAPPQGRRDLLEAVAERTARRSGLAVTPENLLISAGATGGLGAVAGALLQPGDDVLVLTPYWPLIVGILRCYGARPVPVDLLTDGEAEEIRGRLDAARTDACSAIYLSTPNNPSGRVIPAAWIEAIVDWAAEHDLWVFSDEVYEDYVYEGEHAPARPFSPERTFSVHSFSKAFGMAGNRCGYVVGPSERMADLCKVSTHAFYSTPTASQIAAVQVLDGRGDDWLADVRPRYRQAGKDAADQLGLAAPQGSTFLFMDVADQLDERGLIGFLEDCADEGLFLAPGPSFGPHPTHIRICFTAARPEVVGRGVRLLARRLGR
ncbi:MAG: pyridoxal phosphate-dependent aminotransferase [Acidobacteriota bacterium]|nr:pyridoxal phosphate-dependent aminotransferase [Acidobacteriota bacterium]MDH3783756.1 pyridoxal phosphate-dependent aminotransferase [Acidobacteriota bacterium]